MLPKNAFVVALLATRLALLIVWCATIRDNSALTVWLTLYLLETPNLLVQNP